MKQGEMSIQTMANSTLLSRQQAADYFGVTPRTIYNYERQGLRKAKMPGRPRYFYRDIIRFARGI